MTTGLPRYSHDCLRCQFHGRYEQDGTTYDLYVCPSSVLGPTAIARYGNDGSDYLSMDIAVLLYAQQQATHPLVVAASRWLQSLEKQ